MKLLAVFLCVLAVAAAMDGYGAPPPPPEPTTGAPCEPLDESIPEECTETDADTGCQVAIENCPEPTTVAAEAPSGDDQEGYEGAAMTEAPAPKGDDAETEAPEEVVDETEAPMDVTEAPVDVTEGPADATEAPVDVTEAPATGEEAETEAPAPEGDDADGEEAEESSLDTDELPEEGMDIHEYCCWWAQEGECENNPFWMLPRCQKSCGTPGCTVAGAKDCVPAPVTDDCQWQKSELGDAEGAAGEPATVNKVPAVYEKPEGDCVDAHRLCAFWAHSDQCEENGEYMNVNCPAACGIC